MASYQWAIYFDVQRRKEEEEEKKNPYARPNLVGLRCKSRLQMVTIKYRPIQCKNNVLLLFLQDFVGRIAVRKNLVKLKFFFFFF